MPAEEIKRWLRRFPFQPFSLYVLETTRIDIPHPDLYVVDLATLDVYEKSGDPASPEFVRRMTVALRHVSRLATSPSPGGAGAIERHSQE